MPGNPLGPLTKQQLTYNAVHLASRCALHLSFRGALLLPHLPSLKHLWPGYRLSPASPRIPGCNIPVSCVHTLGQRHHARVTRAHHVSREPITYHASQLVASGFNLPKQTSLGHIQLYSLQPALPPHHTDTGRHAPASCMQLVGFLHLHRACHGNERVSLKASACRSR